MLMTLWGKLGKSCRSSKSHASEEKIQLGRKHKPFFQACVVLCCTATWGCQSVKLPNAKGKIEGINIPMRDYSNKCLNPCMKNKISTALVTVYSTTTCVRDARGFEDLDQDDMLEGH